MPRRHHEEEHENHERWLVSYADFITLLFAFFVVMYSISSVNEGKYRVLSGAMTEAFNEDSLRNSEPIQVGEVIRSFDPDNPQTGEGILEEYAPQTGVDSSNTGQEETVPEGYQDHETVTEALEELTEQLEEQGLKVTDGEKWVKVEMESQVLFDSGYARLSDKAAPILNKLVSVINQFKNPLRVEGFTDDRPIRTATFPSNWELSAARAASVVNHFGQQSVDPQRMAAIGYGEFRPVDDNSTAAGRAKNRRIVILISTDAELLKADAARQQIKEEQEEAQEKSKETTEQIMHSIRQPGRETFEE